MDDDTLGTVVWFIILALGGVSVLVGGTLGPGGSPGAGFAFVLLGMGLSVVCAIWLLIAAHEGWLSPWRTYSPQAWYARRPRLGLLVKAIGIIAFMGGQAAIAYDMGTHSSTGGDFVPVAAFGGLTLVALAVLWFAPPDKARVRREESAVVALKEEGLLGREVSEELVQSGKGSWWGRRGPGD